MTFLATVTIAADADTVRNADAPAVGDFLVQLTDNAGAVLGVRNGKGLEYTFPGLVAGDYTVTAQLQDVSGGLIGGISSAGFTITDVPPETTSVKSVSAVSVAVSVE